MTSGSLIFAGREWLWPTVALMVVALAVLVWAYRRAPGGLGLRCCAGTLKTIAIVVLAWCLIEPFFSGTRPRPGANLFVLLADNSQSLEIRDPGARLTRAESLKRHFAKETTWQTRLGQDFDVRRYCYAERLRSLDDDTELTAEGKRSAMATALGTVARRFRGRPLAGVLLFTDGNATDLTGDAINGAMADWSEMPPVYPVPLGRDSPAKDVSIGQVAVSQTNFEQAPVTIRAEITATGYDGEKLVAELLDETGEQLQRQTVDVGEDGQPRVVRFRLRPKRSGVSFYRVRAAAESELDQFDAPRREVEATLVNNEKLADVDRPGGPYRVLYVSGRPNWEFKFLRRAADADDEVELVGLIRIAKREPKFAFLGRGGDPTNPLFKGFTDKDAELTEQYDEPVLIRVGTRDKAELRDGFPKTADVLFQYDAVVLDDVEAAFFTQDQMLLLQEFVSRRGGGVLMLGGAESFRQGEYRHTPIGEMLPVYLDRQPASATEGGYRLSLTREGRLQPWVRLRETEEAESERLESMPTFATLNRSAGIKPGATVLAGAVEESGKQSPALVAQRFGRGRAAALLIGDLWRWQLRGKAEDSGDLAMAWRQTLRWLVAEVPRRIELNVQRRHGSPGSPVEIRVRVDDPEFQPLDNAAVEITVDTPGGRTLKLTADADDERPGTFVAKYLPSESGAYRAKVLVSAPDGSAVGEREAGWTAQPAADEFRRLTPDLALLEQIARDTGGEVIQADRLQEFVADLPNRKIPITEPWLYPLWHHPLIFLLAIAALTSEWGLRRWKGLP